MSAAVILCTYSAWEDMFLDVVLLYGAKLPITGDMGGTGLGQPTCKAGTFILSS